MTKNIYIMLNLDKRDEHGSPDSTISPTNLSASVNTLFHIYISLIENGKETDCGYMCMEISPATDELKLARKVF